MGIAGLLGCLECKVAIWFTGELQTTSFLFTEMKFENFAVEKQIIFNVLEEKRLDIIES